MAEKRIYGMYVHVFLGKPRPTVLTHKNSNWASIERELGITRSWESDVTEITDGETWSYACSYDGITMKEFKRFLKEFGKMVRARKVKADSNIKIYSLSDIRIELFANERDK